MGFSGSFTFLCVTCIGSTLSLPSPLFLSVSGYFALPLQKPIPLPSRSHHSEFCSWLAISFLCDCLVWLSADWFCVFVLCFLFVCLVLFCPFICFRHLVCLNWILGLECHVVKFSLATFMAQIVGDLERRGGTTVSPGVNGVGRVHRSLTFSLIPKGEEGEYNRNGLHWMGRG